MNCLQDAKIQKTELENSVEIQTQIGFVQRKHTFHYHPWFLSHVFFISSQFHTIAFSVISIILLSVSISFLQPILQY